MVSESFILKILQVGLVVQMQMEVVMHQIVTAYNFHSIILLLALILPVVVLQIRVLLLKHQAIGLLVHVNLVIQ